MFFVCSPAFDVDPIPTFSVCSDEGHSPHATSLLHLPAHPASGEPRERPATLRRHNPSPPTPRRTTDTSASACSVSCPNYKAADQQAVYVHTLGPREVQDRRAEFPSTGRTSSPPPASPCKTKWPRKAFTRPPFGKNFAEYYARGYADSVIGNFVTQGVLPLPVERGPALLPHGDGHRMASHAARAGADRHHPRRQAEATGFICRSWRGTRESSR